MYNIRSKYTLKTDKIMRFVPYLYVVIQMGLLWFLLSFYSADNVVALCVLMAPNMFSFLAQNQFRNHLNLAGEGAK